ncbi:MAG: hypothetical protein ACRD16_16990 [Thermoanaerobaculia bacterium]
MPRKIRISKLTTTVPYDALDSGADGVNSGFKDLRQHPESIAEIPELADSPALRRFIEAINNPGSRFWSLGCEKALSRSDEKPGFPWRLNAYVAVAFALMPWNASPGHFEALAARARAYFNARIPDDATYLDFELYPTNFRDAGVHGFALSLWFGAYGRNEADARARWETVASNLADFFLREGGAGHEA